MDASLAVSTKRGQAVAGPATSEAWAASATPAVAGPARVPKNRSTPSATSEAWAASATAQQELRPPGFSYHQKPLLFSKVAAIVSQMAARQKSPIDSIDTGMGDVGKPLPKSPDKRDLV